MTWNRDFSNVHLCIPHSEKPHCFPHCSVFTTAELFNSTSLDNATVFSKEVARLSEIIWCLPPSSLTSQVGLYSGPLWEGLLWRFYQMPNHSQSDVLTFYFHPLWLPHSTWHVLPPVLFETVLVIDCVHLFTCSTGIYWGAPDMIQALC